MLYVRDQIVSLAKYTYQTGTDEARCQIVVRAQAPLEAMFFPDALDLPSSENLDSLAAEALSEALQAPTRPNVSLYNPSERAAREKREEVAGQAASAFGVLGIWTGEDERFAYVSVQS